MHEDIADDLGQHAQLGVLFKSSLDLHSFLGTDLAGKIPANQGVIEVAPRLLLLIAVGPQFSREEFPGSRTVRVRGHDPYREGIVRVLNSHDSSSVHSYRLPTAVHLQEF